MKLYCLAAASLMLLGAAVAEEPNLRGVATTFKEQVAEALGNPDDIEMYQRCTFDACCMPYEDDEDSEDIKMLYGKCSCPGQINCDGGGGGEGRRGGGGGEGCAHCEDCCMYKGSDSFLTYCRGEGKRESCMNNGCCEDDGPPPPPPRPRGPPNGGGGGGCSQYNGNPAQCAMNGCLPMGGMGGIKCIPQEDSEDVEMEDLRHDNGCGNLSPHCQDCYCNGEGEGESSDSFLSYCNPRSCPDSCRDSFDCDGGEERGHGGHGGFPGHGPPHGPPNGGGGGCSQYNGNPAQCAMNGCLPMGPSQCGPR